MYSWRTIMYHRPTKCTRVLKFYKDTEISTKKKKTTSIQSKSQERMRCVN